MKAWKVILAALVLFAAGATTGAVIARWQAHRAYKAEQSKRSPLPPMAWQRLEFLRRAQRDLSLNDEQKARIDGLLKDSQERFRKLWEPIAPQARAEFETLRDRIRAELTPEQQQRFDELLKKTERRRSRDADGKRTGETNRAELKPTAKD